MRHIKLILIITSFLGTLACGGSNSPFGNGKLPVMRGTWNMIFTGASASQGAPAPPGVTLTVTLSQQGGNLAGSVVAVSNPSSSCLASAIGAGTTFAMSGSVMPPGEAIENLGLQINFASGSLTGMISANGFAEGSNANGLFNLAPNLGCAGGTFTMQKIA